MFKIFFFNVSNAPFDVLIISFSGLTTAVVHFEDAHSFAAQFIVFCLYPTCPHEVQIWTYHLTTATYTSPTEEWDLLLSFQCPNLLFPAVNHCNCVFLHQSMKVLHVVYGLSLHPLWSSHLGLLLSLTVMGNSLYLSSWLANVFN